MKQTFTDGVHNISNEEYHTSNGLSRSALWKFKKSPALYQYEYLNPDFAKPEPTLPMMMGNLVHCLALEPHTFDEQYIVTPKLDRRTKEGKAKVIEFEQIAQGKVVLNQEQYDLATNMAQKILANDAFAALLNGSKVEQSIFFTHERTGLQCKVRPDVWLNNIVGDLKTADNATLRAFQSVAHDKGYYLQAGMIHEGLRSLGIKLEKFVFPVVEKKEPHLDALYVLDQEAIDYGINQFNKLMDDYLVCLKNDSWPGYGIQSLSIPGYAKLEEI